MTFRAGHGPPLLVTASSRALLGEGPVWDERTQVLYWVDIERGELHCREDRTALERTVRIGQRIGCVALRREQPGFIAGLEHSVAVLTLDPLSIEPFALLDPAQPGNRSNDGKCDAEGRFWVGTSNPAGTAATGWLFRVDPSGELARTVGPYVCVNGPAFSPDGRTLYCVDSYGRTVHRYDLQRNGELVRPGIFRKFEDSWGYPDGLTCDVEGCLWIAHWGGSRISRFSPEGDLLDAIELPVAQPSSCTFGGPDLRRLYITSASQGLDARSNADGLAGAVFAVEVDVAGLPAWRYDG